MRRLTIITAVSLTLVLAAGMAVATVDLRAQARPTWDNDRVLTILIIGSDMGLPRPGDPKRGRADGLHLLAVDTRRHTATVVNIPRDSLVGGTKVNAHLASGGPQRMKSVMSSFTGIDIDYYALTSFRGLRGLVNGMGGVTVELDRPIRDAAARANIGGGKQKLDGKKALAFTRARKTVPGGDFTRSKHHGDLMLAAHRKIRAQQSDLPSMVRLLGVFSRNVETDIPNRELLRLASLAVKIHPRDVKQISLSGPTGFSGGQSIVHLNAGSAFSDIRQRRIGR
ncbi:MAG TPA: LCP family protein [Egibacteraceae bacterium]|nr:LCP family protein [Egibacteraceae bacterium]